MDQDFTSWPAALLEEMQRQAMNGRVGQDLLSETEAVRVWRIALRPGERVGFHRRVLDYFWVAVRAGKSRSHYAEGDTRETAYAAGDTRHFHFGPGEFMLNDLENIGDSILEFVTVEFKSSDNPPLPIS